MESLLKRKMSPNVQSEDFNRDGQFSSPAFSLIKMFLGERKDNNLLSNRGLQSFQREPLVLEFLSVVYKILKLDPKEKDNLRQVFDDIKTLGLNILDIEPQDNIISTIVNGATEVPKEKWENIDGLVKVNPNPRKGIDQELIDWGVKLVVDHLYPKKDNPTPLVLEDNFAPVRVETRPTSNVKITGEIPRDLNGMMVRNGPDPVYDPVAKYGWLDGDSMLHAIRFQEGRATYVSRYVHTSRYIQEKFFEEAQFLKFGDLKGIFGLFMASVQLLKLKIGVLDVSYGWLNGNTGLVYHNNKLMALQDWDKPYIVNVKEDGDLVTLGAYNYGKQTPHSFLPHPKKDPITGEMFFLGVSNTPPYTFYNHVNKKGCVSKAVPITTLGPTYMHDFGITKNYVVFMDLPFCYDPEKMVKDGVDVHTMDLSRKARFGILPRYATTEDGIVWFEFDDPFFIFHNGNSWEEDEDTIILISCLMEYGHEDPPNTQVGSGLVKRSFGDSITLGLSSARAIDPDAPTNSTVSFKPARLYSGPCRKALRPAHLYSGPCRRKRTPKMMPRALSLQGPFDGKAEDLILYSANVGETNVDVEEKPTDEEPDLPTLYKFTFNMSTKKAIREEITKTYCDYPKINENFIGRKSRFVYTSEFTKDLLNTSIVKTDLQWKTELKLNLADKSGSEVAFVPYHSSLEEDCGYLTTFVHDEYMSLSYAYVIDAKQMQILAMIQLPERVPYGFHSIFVTEEELQSQMIAST